MSDSLISGQPLYLLYSNCQRGPAPPACFAAALAAQATGRVRLQVTGSPPTTSLSWGPLALEQDRLARGEAAAASAAAPFMNSRRLSIEPRILAAVNRPGPSGVQPDVE